MGKLVILFSVLIGLSLSSGCTMCADCDLDDYGAYGGRWQRTNRTSGRVGSVFDPAGAQVPYEAGAASMTPAAENGNESSEEDADASGQSVLEPETRESMEERAKRLQDKTLDDIRGSQLRTDEI